MADIITRAGKGSKLTHEEMDSNLNEITILKETPAVSTSTLTSIVQGATNMTLNLADVMFTQEMSDTINSVGTVTIGVLETEYDKASVGSAFQAELVRERRLSRIDFFSFRGSFNIANLNLLTTPSTSNYMLYSGATPVVGDLINLSTEFSDLSIGGFMKVTYVTDYEAEHIMYNTLTEVILTP